MKALAVLGTSSNAGKSWVATALCAWLRQQGVRVAPFKTQNMSNNSYVTLSGGEIGRAQAAQAEACGLEPCVEMNPVLLKPSGALGSQLVVLGKARGHLSSQQYYRQIEELWSEVEPVMQSWSERCDLLVIEGAGSPVELNLMQRDIANLRTVEALDAAWLLVADIERGGVFAQLAGTWKLLDASSQKRCLGAVVNKFRGDLSLFADAEKFLAPHFGAPLLGTLPYAAELQPESEDSLCEEAEQGAVCDPDAPLIAFIRLPHLSNSSDIQSWTRDRGVRVRWVRNAEELREAAAIVLPGSKNSVADLDWLRSTGMAAELQRAAERGAAVCGICGGYQMLGLSLRDGAGVAGDAGEVEGIGLLPVETQFFAEKTVRRVELRWPETEPWLGYEIHMGQTELRQALAPLLSRKLGGQWQDEGVRSGRVWGTYLHGLFEAPQVRADFCRAANIATHQPDAVPWRKRVLERYDAMALWLEKYVNLEPVKKYVGC